MPEVPPVTNPLPAKPSPVADGRYHGQTIGSLHEDGLLIYVFEDALDQVLTYSEQDLRRERGGFLLGGVHWDERQYVEVREFLPAEDTRQQAASLCFTHGTWALLNRQVSQQFPGEQVLGWHHTHPNFGVFLSRYDLFIHRNFFPLPWQIALVVDPVRQQLRFFQWRGEDVVDTGFICVQSERHD